MNPEQIALVKSTFEQVRPVSDAAASMFYDRLFEIEPATKPLFDGVDMKKLGRC